MPDPQRPLRRLTHSRSLARAVTHIAVIGLVAFAAATGIVAARGQVIGSTHASTAGFLPFELVARARGAANAEPAIRSRTFDLVGGSVDPMLQPREVHLRPPPEPTPLPTPIEPPLPAPDPPVVAALPPAPPPVVKGSGALAWPVHGGTITTYFSSAHMALDIAAPAGSAAMAADAGVITWAGWRNNGGGLVVGIDHGNGITTLYNHLGSISVEPGQAVAKGQLIGSVGCTGMCTGPHVHFEVIVGGLLVNPLRYL
ncbi:MAG TPA: M23 family metallopeptidase [Candidatus Limnocylindria bacterium]